MFAPETFSITVKTKLGLKAPPRLSAQAGVACAQMHAQGQDRPVPLGS